MRHLWGWTFLLLLIFMDSVGAGIFKTPLRGKWDFKQEMAWEIYQAGDDVFGEPGALLVSEQGTGYFHDTKNMKHYMISRDGKFIRAFGKRGEGPGEVNNFWESELFMVDDRLVVTDAAKIHYFTLRGEYIRSVINNLFRRRPVHFLGKNKFIYSPVYKREMPDGIGKICIFDLKSAVDRILIPFKIPDSGTISMGNAYYSFDIGGLTPMMTVACHENKVYYGMNDSNVITVCDLEGNNLNQFSLDCRRTPVSEEAKRKLFGTWGERPEVVEKMIKATPEVLTCFVRIDIQNQLIFIYRAFFGPSQRSQIVDIFSSGGQYLYQASFHPSKNSMLYLTHLKNLVVRDGFLYAFEEDKDGEIKLVKYRVKLPGYQG